MKITYDVLADAIHIRLRNSLANDSDEVSPGIFISYGEGGQVISIEILDASRRVHHPGNVDFEVTPAK